MHTVDGNTLIGIEMGNGIGAGDIVDTYDRTQRYHLPLLVLDKKGRNVIFIGTVTLIGLHKDTVGFTEFIEIIDIE